MIYKIYRVYRIYMIYMIFMIYMICMICVICMSEFEVPTYTPLNKKDPNHAAVRSLL